LNIEKKEVKPMTLYMVSYDLNSPGQNYKSLYEKLESYPDILHPMESFWLISTTQTTQQIYENITQGIAFDKNDRLLISKITNSKQGLLTKTEWEWINKRI